MSYKLYVRINSSQDGTLKGFDNIYDIASSTITSSYQYQALTTSDIFAAASYSVGDRILVGNTIYATGIYNEINYLVKSIDGGLLWTKLASLPGNYTTVYQRKINGCQAGNTNYFVHNFAVGTATATLSLNGGVSFDYTINTLNDLPSAQNEPLDNTQYYITPRYLYAFRDHPYVLRYSIDNLTAAPNITGLRSGSTSVNKMANPDYYPSRLIQINPSMGDNGQDLIYLIGTDYYSSAARQAAYIDLNRNSEYAPNSPFGYYENLMISRDSGQTFTTYLIPYEFFEYNTINTDGTSKTYFTRSSVSSLCVQGQNILIGGYGKYAFSSNGGNTWIIGNLGIRDTFIDFITPGLTDSKFYAHVFWSKDLNGLANNTGSIYTVDFSNATTSQDVIINDVTSTFRPQNRIFARATSLIRYNTIINPTDININNNTISENSPINTTIGTLSTDDQSGTSITYELLNQTDKFNILNNVLRSSIVFDYESLNSYNVEIRSTNATGGYYDKIFTILIANAPPSSINLSSVYIQENIQSGTNIATISGVDPAGGTLVFNLVSGIDSDDNNSFEILGTTLKLASNVSINYESKNEYKIRLRATDSSGLYIEQPFILTVTNLNESPTDIILSNNSISENNEINAVIGSLTGIDPDLNESFVFSIVSGSDKFNINDNNLRASVVFDYESNTSHDVTIRITDLAGLTFDKTFTINVTNVVETPTNLSLSSTSIFENNTVNQIIGTISNNEPDNTVTYSIVPNVGDYTAFNINENKLRASIVFNYELKNLYTVRIRATDIFNSIKEQTFLIGIQNDVENPTNITLSSTTITSSNAPNAIIGTLTATDPEGSSLTFSIVSGQGDQYFNVALVSGLWRLRAKSSFDVANVTEYQVTVQATNSNGNSSNETFTITVYPLSSSENVQYTSNSALTFDSGIVYLSVDVNPLTTVIYYNNLPLPTGSVVVNSLTGQKFIKNSGGSLNYLTVPTQPPTTWKWGDDGAILWELLQSI